MIMSLIRYQFDPSQDLAFTKYAEDLAYIIPRCGGHLVGHFLPQDGVGDVGWGLVAFRSLEEYETYLEKLGGDQEAQHIVASATQRRLILREDRTLLKPVSLDVLESWRIVGEPDDVVYFF